MSKEFIVRLREAAAQRVASTAMIGADDLIAAADALESLGADRDSWERQAGDRLDDVLRVVAERDALANRVYQLEQKNSGAAEIIAAMQETHAEDQAELKALREQKPVARIDDDESFQGPCRHAMAFVPMHRGSPLYAHPVPARELTDAVDDLAQHIRQIDGNHSMGAGELAESIAEWVDRYLKGEAK